ncbi:uncharacterized protein LOC128183442 isoform X3 [Crassostrea angulata]|uniref:uncharacterized protein LOC128183442 isoform X3 n=1 Tax=Magallana angulata TaxID=2784310 RepID=UPI0022B21700|nr:uncharacterized protein LOC128183442 isoform X3 [Crassostrea angulata]
MGGTGTVSDHNAVCVTVTDTSESSSEITSDSDGSGSLNEFPKSTSAWDCHFVDKLGVRYRQCDIYEIILNRWRLFNLFKEDYLQVESCLKACDLEANYDSLEDIPVEKAFAPEIQWRTRVQTQENDILREPLVSKWFLGKLTEINRCIASIISQMKPGGVVSELKYQVLFEKVLQAFGLTTLSDPFIVTQKAQILGRTTSSKADILCCRDDLVHPVIFVCEVKKTLSRDDDDLSPPKKKLRTSSLIDAETSYIGDQKIWSQHIGELFVHLELSPISDRVLGFTIEKTWIRVTFLKVHPTGMQKIQNTPVNRPGSLKLNDGEYPEFYYSRRYNFLKRQDRKDLFKALLLIKMMEVRREAARKS